MTETTWKIRFDDDTPLPSTERECREEMANLSEMMIQIDVQFSAHRAGTYKADDPTWHPRALSAKSHIARRRRKLKAHLRDLLPPPREITPEMREIKAQRALENEANRQKNLAKYKVWYQAVFDWVWVNHPDLRDDISQFVGDLKRAEKAGEQTGAEA